MVVEIIAIEGSGKGIKVTALVIHSRTHAKSIRLYRARTGGSSGVF